MKKEYTLKISEEALSIIGDALDCYSRLGVNQFDYCLEHNPEFRSLDFSTRHQIDSYIKTHGKFPSYGIYHENVERFKKAFEVKQQIDLNIAIRNAPIISGYSNKYDGPLYGGDHVPIFVDENGNVIKHEIKIDVPSEYVDELKSAGEKKDYEKMWNIAKKFLNVDGASFILSEDYRQVTVEKPRVKNK